MDQPLFVLKNVFYSYPGNIPALCDIDLSIYKGDRVAIIGANGTGKSTLLTLLDALIFADKGSVQAFDIELCEKEMNKADVQRMFRLKAGFVFQNPDIQLFCPTVKEDLVFGPLQLGVDTKEISQRLSAIADYMNLSHLLDRSPHQLSIGEKKKVAIATVLIMQPEVIILDEPTAGLDPQTTRDIIDVIATAHKNGKTVIMATHDLHIVEEIADVIHIFGKNKTIIRSGSPEEIFGDNAFLEANNLIHVHVHRHLHTKHVHPHTHEHGHDNV